MSLIEKLVELQREAIAIAPPKGTNLLPARGGLSGLAFFPEGLGLSDGGKRKATPSIMAIGHNFGCDEYCQRITPVGREDNEATWRNLDQILRNAGAHPDDCFRTNWFVGLLPGNKQTGIFLNRDDVEYEECCRRLLIRQIEALRPSTILILGPEVARRAYKVFPSLQPWKSARNWSEIDNSPIGHSVFQTEVRGTTLRVNVAALLHPSFSAPNQGRRMKNMSVPITEANIVRGVYL